MSRPIERILTEGSFGYENYQPLVPDNTSKESDYGRVDASVDTMQYLFGSALELFAEGSGFENLSAYAKSVREGNLEDLKQYERTSWEKAEFGNNLAKYFFDLAVIDGASMIATGTAALGAGALTGGSAWAAMAAALAAGGTMSAILNSGETYAASIEAVGKENVDKSLVLTVGLLQGSLDVLLPGKVAGKFLNPVIRKTILSGAAKNLARDGVKGWLGRAAVQGFQGSLTEGSTEMLQEVLKEAAINHQKGMDDIFDFSEEQEKSFKESWIGGAFLGGGIQVATSSVGRSNALKIVSRKQEAVAEIDSELNSNIETIQLEIKDLEAQAKAGGGRKVLARKVSLENKIKSLEKEAKKKTKRVLSSSSVANINKLVPIKEEEKSTEEAEGEKTLDQQIAEGLTLQQIKDADRLKQSGGAAQPETSPPTSTPELTVSLEPLTPEEQAAEKARIAESERIKSLQETVIVEADANQQFPQRPPQEPRNNKLRLTLEEL